MWENLYFITGELIVNYSGKSVERRILNMDFEINLYPDYNELEIEMIQLEPICKNNPRIIN